MNLFSHNKGKWKTFRVNKFLVVFLLIICFSIVYGAADKTTTKNQQLIFQNKSLNYNLENIQIFEPIKATGSDNNDLDDFDNDGLSNELERVYNTDPFLNDSDFDGLLDGDEVFIYLTTPSRADSDLDYLCDSVEIFKYKTNPLKSDTDGDKIDDGIEICVFKSNALIVDTDYDMLDDYEEKYIYNTNVNKEDTDLDGISDGMEVYVYKTNPLSYDTDGDSKSDQWEIDNNRNPNIADNWYNITGYIIIPGIPFVALLIGMFASVDNKLVSSLRMRTQVLFKYETAEKRLYDLLCLVPDNCQIDVDELSLLTGESVEQIQMLINEIFHSINNKSELDIDNVVIKSHSELVQFNYNCFYCAGEIDYIADICSACLKPIVRCKVCNNPISFNDNYATCTRCGVIGKRNDIFGVLQIELICERCLMTTKYNYV